jgi:hypothetical protein
MDPHGNCLDDMQKEFKAIVIQAGAAIGDAFDKFDNYGKGFQCANFTDLADEDSKLSNPTKIAARMCTRLMCQNGYRANALSGVGSGFNPEGYTQEKYQTAYGFNNTYNVSWPVVAPGLFDFGAEKPDWDTFTMPYGIDNFICPDDRAVVVPLLYSFFICFTSPLMMLFFLFVLGARHEDALWQQIPQHKWLYQIEFEKVRKRCRWNP